MIVTKEIFVHILLRKTEKEREREREREKTEMKRTKEEIVCK